MAIFANMKKIKKKTKAPSAAVTKEATAVENVDAENTLVDASATDATVIQSVTDETASQLATDAAASQSTTDAAASQLITDAAASQLATDDAASESAIAAKSAVEVFEDPWLTSERDYTYSELIGRIFRVLRANNPELAGEKKKINMVLPIVNRESSKKSTFSNLPEVCKRLNRTPEHLIQFLLAELGTTGSVDGANALVIRGRFQQKQIEAVLKRYVQDYVQCKTCRSAETSLIKENRLYFIKCEVCGSSRTVSTIKSGFKAQSEKKAAQLIKKSS